MIYGKISDSFCKERVIDNAMRSLFFAVQLEFTFYSLLSVLWSVVL